MSDRRHFLKSSLGGLAVALAGCQQNPAQPKAAQAARIPMETVKVTDRVSVISGAPGNVLVLASGDGVLVDSGSVALAPAVRKQLAGAGVHTLFNTHYHADQTGGNALFAKAGAEIHAHTITRQWLATDYYVPAEDRWVKAPPKEAVPTVTFRSKGEMKAGAETIVLGSLAFGATSATPGNGATAPAPVSEEPGRSQAARQIANETSAIRDLGPSGMAPPVSSHSFWEGDIRVGRPGGKGRYTTMDGHEGRPLFTV